METKELTLEEAEKIQFEYEESLIDEGVKNLGYLLDAMGFEGEKRQQAAFNSGKIKINERGNLETV